MTSIPPPPYAILLHRRELHRSLLRWFVAHGTPWPWRQQRDPYSVWVAETMLQQTRLSVAAQAYPRFLGRFPTIYDLAEASEDDVLAAWSGLGYYTRARNLRAAARILVQTNAGRFPSTLEEARALPGVGPYTAAAVLSIACQQPYAAVDGNVRRVLSRWLGLTTEEAARSGDLPRIAEKLLPEKRPGAWNEALMELGQKVCLPQRPRCESCPVGHLCSFRWMGSRARWQTKPRKPPTARQELTANLYFLQDQRGRYLLERGGFPYLNHLWLPHIRLCDSASDPRPPLTARRFQPCGVVRHTIVQRNFVVHVWYGRIPEAKAERLLTQPPPGIERRWFSKRELSRIGRSALLTKALNVLSPSGRTRRLGSPNPVATASKAGQQKAITLPFELLRREER